MISFYPGPSRVHDAIPKWVKAAQQKGILSMNHRSPEFEVLSKKTIELLKEKLIIPEDYSVFFLSSATECWEVIAQSLVGTKSIHLFNGAFGEKWFDYTHRLRPAAQPIRFDPEKELNPKELVFKEGDVICLTQNETSNGTQVSNEILDTLKKNNPDHLIAVDATSSMAGIELNFILADVWFASVQKCFGLPAGLGILICSPEAIRRVDSISEKDHYNSLTFMAAMMEKWQTPFTPNVMGIYLLMRILKKMKPIVKVHKKVLQRSEAWAKFFHRGKNLSLLITNKSVRSLTVIAVSGNPETIEGLKRKARKKGLLLGEGYGILRQTTFRIANFPALKKAEIKQLMNFLQSYL